MTDITEILAALQAGSPQWVVPVDDVVKALNARVTELERVLKAANDVRLAPGEHPTREERAAMAEAKRLAPLLLAERDALAARVTELAEWRRITPGLLDQIDSPRGCGETEGSDVADARRLLGEEEKAND